MARRKFTPEDRRNNELVGQRLRKVLDAYGLKQTDLADALKVSPSTVNEWLSGKKALDVNWARAIRDKFDVSLDYLYCDDHSSLRIELARAILRGEPLKSRTTRA